MKLLEEEKDFSIIFSVQERATYLKGLAAEALELLNLCRAEDACALIRLGCGAAEALPEQMQKAFTTAYFWECCLNKNPIDDEELYNLSEQLVEELESYLNKKS